MEIIRDIVLSITAVSIFSTVIISLSGNKAIVRIGCGCLVIISLISPFRSNGMDFPNMEDIYSEYSITSDEAEKSALELKKKMICERLERLVLETLNEEVQIDVDDDFYITKVLVNKDVNISEICTLLGIKQPMIEYIESR